MRYTYNTLIFLLFAASASAKTAYVDSSISADCENYAPATRSCGSGGDTAYSDLSTGLAALGPGDTLHLRAGNYGQLSVQRSGTNSSPIIISGYEGEVATISSSSSIGLSVIEHTDVEIRNLFVVDVVGFGRIENSQRIIIDDISFENASSSGTTGSLKFVRSTYNKVLNSRFAGGSDLMILQDDSDRNVIQGNAFGRAAHSLISIRCSGENVIRANEFNNPDQKAVELYDCEGVSDAPYRLDDTKRNILENNRFLGTAPSDRNYRYNAIQHGGQHTIVRNNVFAHNLGGGSNYQYYSDESLHVYGNRLYNNTFYSNRCYAIIGAGSSASTFYDNQAINNLLFENVGCNLEDRQIDIGNPDTVILRSNSMVQQEPGFMDPGANDFRLTPGSSQIDGGAFVTTAQSSGNGTRLVVEDASWFFDGLGIPSEEGDMIRLEGQSQSARIISIDYESSALTLDRELEWNAGDGVHLNYDGIAPDFGAFEFNGNSRTPQPPTDLRAD